MNLKKIVVILTIVVLAGFIVSLRYQFYRSSVLSSSDDAVLLSGGPLKDGIPSISNPKFETVSAADSYLDDEGFGLVVLSNGKTRFYPYQILVWHEVVNDVFGGKPLAIVYCSLCFSGGAYERTINGIVSEFGVSGKLTDNFPILYDKQTDELLLPPIENKLTMYPSFVTKWKNFKSNFANGQVLSRETGFERDYTANPYKNYESNNSVLFPVSYQDDRLAAKTTIFGYTDRQNAKAYPMNLIKSAGSVQDIVGDKQIEIYWDEKFETVRANVILRSFYWFSWVSLYPESELFVL